MSHFCVMVVLDRPANNAPASPIPAGAFLNALKAKLQPFHEFECTGENDQYVVDTDVTAELRQLYEKGTDSFLKAPDGTLHDPYADDFYRDPTPEEQEKIGPRENRPYSGVGMWRRFSLVLSGLERWAGLSH